MAKCCMVRDDGTRCDAEIPEGDEICEACSQVLDRLLEAAYWYRLEYLLRIAERN